MVIYKRNILVQKTQANVIKILQSSTYQRDFEIDHQTFSFKCPKRNQRGRIMFVPIKGQLTGTGDSIRVTLELHPGVEVLIGLSVCALGLAMMLLRCIFPGIGKPTYGVITTGMGIVISVFYWFRGIEAIDLLEHKITR